MARQSTTPVTHAMSKRTDRSVAMSSGRAGLVQPIAFIPLHPEDSCSGRAGVDVMLKEMPKPLLNAVHANFQAWFVPKSAHPQFPGRDELMHAFTGEAIKSLGAADRAPPPFYSTVTGATLTTLAASTFFKSLGLHIPTGQNINSDLVDAFNVIYNFRLAAHSSRLTRRKYVAESAAEASALPPAFWPSSRMSAIVPDYERALVVGSFDLDVIAGTINYSGNIPVSLSDDVAARSSQRVRHAGNGGLASGNQSTSMPLSYNGGSTASSTGVPGALHHVDNRTATFALDPGTSLQGLVSGLTGSFQGDSISVSLADIDKARTTQAFAKLRTAYAGNDATGFDNDDTIVALLMQGIGMPQPDDFKRPWLLDSKRVGIGFAERFATDAANLDASVTLGRASAQLSLNVPRQNVSGVIIITVEVLPERIDERQSDEWLHCLQPDDLPNALRDIQRTEPVDMVQNRRIDAKHTTPNGLYGYEPMNNKWNRDFTRLGGEFYQATPGAGWTENRSNIWQTEIVNPAFGTTHYLAPSPFPHDVFSDQDADAFEVVCRHDVTIMGITQIGDVLAENNDDYDAVAEAGL